MEGVGAAGRPSAERVAGGLGEPERPPGRVLPHRRDVLLLRRLELHLCCLVPSSRGGRGGGEEEGGAGRGGELTEDAAHGGAASCAAGVVAGGGAGRLRGNDGRTREVEEGGKWETASTRAT